MAQRKKPAAPRYLIVLEASFPKGDPGEDSLETWKKTLESDPDCPCERIRFRHMELIATEAEGAEVWPQSEQDPYRQRWHGEQLDAGFRALKFSGDYAEAHTFAAHILGQIPGGSRLPSRSASRRSRRGRGLNWLNGCSNT
jgi:hypothetical protein